MNQVNESQSNINFTQKQLIVQQLKDILEATSPEIQLKMFFEDFLNNQLWTLFDDLNDECNWSKIFFQLENVAHKI